MFKIITTRNRIFFMLFGVALMRWRCPLWVFPQFSMQQQQKIHTITLSYATSYIMYETKDNSRAGVDRSPNRQTQLLRSRTLLFYSIVSGREQVRANTHSSKQNKNNTQRDQKCNTLGGDISIEVLAAKPKKQHQQHRSTQQINTEHQTSHSHFPTKHRTPSADPDTQDKISTKTTKATVYT